jgi:hypothetical protein
MKILLSIVFLIVINVSALSQFESSKVCQKCHPTIYKEHFSSSHRKASIHNDEIHKAVWDKHPLKQKKMYKCAKCHTPNDRAMIVSLKDGRKAMPKDNKAQQEGVSCVSCHNIKSVEKHAKSNKNIITNDKKKLYSARESEKSNKRKSYSIKSSWFGMVREESGSPFHDIDFSNENYYNANVCIGCHSHKQNAHKLEVCTMELDKNPNTTAENCITCHMPKVQGSFTTLSDSKTHRYHGFVGTMHKPKMLSKYVEFGFEKKANGFDITVQNLANHALLLHPLRVGELRVNIISQTDRVKLKPVKFMRLIGKDSKPSTPWVADEVVKDNQLKAKEKRVIHFDTNVKSGDVVEVQLGHYTVNPKMAKKLGINNKELTTFKLFKKEKFSVK